MLYELIRYETFGNVALITFNNPARRNAWGVPMYREIVHAVGCANDDDEIGAIVITSQGPIFCAGTDFKAAPEPKDPETGKRPNVATVTMAQDESWLHLLAKSKPSIIAVNGAAIGLGVTQILAADIRMGSKSSTYVFPFLKLGLMPELGATALLPQLVGYGRAVDLCLTAATIDASEAYRIGLITRICEDESLVADAIALASTIGGYSRLEMSLTKRMFHDNLQVGDKNQVLKTEIDAFVEMFKAKAAAKQSQS